eukprot:3261852-Rhodomonas_salina.2
MRQLLLHDGELPEQQQFRLVRVAYGSPAMWKKLRKYPRAEACRGSWSRACASNQAMATECEQGACDNRQLQHGDTPRLVVGPIRGSREWGAFTRDSVEKGTVVAEYVGEYIDEAELRRRYPTEKDGKLYFCAVENGVFIDAGRAGGYSRFCNHACFPSMEMSKRIVCGRLKIQLVAKEDLGPRAEATFNYGYEDGRMRVVCRCGHRQCTGYINRVPRAFEELEGSGGADNDVTVSDGAGDGEVEGKEEGVRDDLREGRSVLAVACTPGS